MVEEPVDEADSVVVSVEERPDERFEVGGGCSGVLFDSFQRRWNWIRRLRGLCRTGLGFAWRACPLMRDYA